ncbi:MAG: hypothetical protein M4D80_22900 [Myxococcota bacterium]|nr:hypothetical protein [Deltaproteobacteria bacterium]MDQ3338023.1 hypothetical protein [Myxococcota bacterium]
MRGVGLVVLLFTSMAHASPAAEKLFQDGKKLVADGKLAEGCDALRKSNELEERVGTYLNLGDCEEKRGRVATAWETFIKARALATQKSHPGAAEADKRAAALEKKLPYLTVRTPATRPAGLVVKRDGREVPAAELDQQVPIDPGRYEIEASATGRVTWKETSVVAAGQKLVVDIPELAIDPDTQTRPVATTVTPPVVVDDGGAARPSIESPSILSGKTRVGAGLAIGMSTDEDLIFGLRIPVQLAPVGPGAIRALPSVFYAQFSDPEDPYRKIKLYAIGLGLEYVHPIAPTFFVAGGVGVGLDLIDDNYADGISRQSWGALRLSPTLKLGRSIDIGLHFQVVKTSDRTVGLGELGVDYFFY